MNSTESGVPRMPNAGSLTPTPSIWNAFSGDVVPLIETPYVSALAPGATAAGREALERSRRRGFAAGGVERDAAREVLRDRHAGAAGADVDRRRLSDDDHLFRLQRDLLGEQLCVHADGGVAAHADAAACV